ncbi:hypothetical protein B0O80DRAFT_495458 [Mortierella sp. GBAus27b]|nr:hypothetical protein BGX31_005680 [Mortierella sp. GBA43]KAI8358793.1 hypothetical protein B0O80DRAFT_495458 [Mortierella sp. GBAus27b]
MSLIDSAHFVRDTPTSELAEIMANPESFRLFYFNVHGRAQTSRDILEYGGAKWEMIHPDPSLWGQHKGETPLGCMPVLHVIKGNKKVILAESIPIEQYLGKHFGLLGKNEYEGALIKAFHSSSLMMMGIYAGFVTYNMPEVYDVCLEKFKETHFKNWINTHERHLIDNGSNGFYFGENLTIADIMTANLITHFEVQPECGPELIEIIKKAPALWKVKETVDTHPRLLEYRNSKAYKDLYASTEGFYKMNRDATRKN